MLNQNLKAADFVSLATQITQGNMKIDQPCYEKVFFLPFVSLLTISET